MLGEPSRTIRPRSGTPTSLLSFIGGPDQCNQCLRPMLIEVRGRCDRLQRSPLRPEVDGERRPLGLSAAGSFPGVWGEGETIDAIEALHPAHAVLLHVDEGEQACVGVPGEHDHGVVGESAGIDVVAVGGNRHGDHRVDVEAADGPEVEVRAWALRRRECQGVAASLSR